MTTSVLQHVPSFEDVGDRLVRLTDVKVPRLQVVGRQADAAIDRLRGRPRTSSWLRVALGLGVLGLVIAAIATLAVSGSWGRRRAESTTDGALDQFDQFDQMSESGAMPFHTGIGPDRGGSMAPPPGGALPGSAMPLDHVPEVS